MEKLCSCKFTVAVILILKYITYFLLLNLPNAHNIHNHIVHEHSNIIWCYGTVFRELTPSSLKNHLKYTELLS